MSCLSLSLFLSNKNPHFSYIDQLYSFYIYLYCIFLTTVEENLITHKQVNKVVLCLLKIGAKYGISDFLLISTLKRKLSHKCIFAHEEKKIIKKIGLKIQKPIRCFYIIFY